MRLIAGLLAVALVAGPVPAQQTRTAAPGSTPPPAKVTDLAWLEGTWSGEGFGARLQETYTAAVGGQMPGHFSITSEGRPSLYEFVMIAEVGPSIEYRVRHINPDMTAWEEKERFVRFPLVAVDKDAWYFDGLTIRRTGPDNAEHVVLVKSRDGTEKEELLRYRRVK